MFVRTLYITADPEDIGPALDVITKAVPGMMAEQTGFHGIGIFADRTLGKIITGSWWESKQDLEQSDEKLRQRRVEGLTPFVSTIAAANMEAAAYTRPAASSSGGIRLVRFALDPKKADDLVQLFKKNALPRMQTIDGFEGASLLLDREHHMASIGVIFRDMEALAASRSPQAAARKAGMDQLKDVQLIALEELEVVELDIPTPKK